MNALRPVELLVPPHWAPDALAGVLDEGLNLAVTARHTFRRSYYDSFDWRLYRHGLEFTVEAVDHRHTSILFDAEGEHYGESGLSGPPRFPADLPDSAFRSQLAEVLDLRVLLPQLELIGNRTELVLANENGDTVLFLTLNHCTLDGSGSGEALRGRLRLTAVKGHTRTCRRILDQLASECTLEPAGPSLLAEALAALGRTPDDPSALRFDTPDPELRSDAAVKRVLLRLLDIIEAHEEGVKADWDTEFLHDFRVAGRRTRSALGEIKHVFPRPTAGRFTREFAELGRATSMARDLDVYLLLFDDFKAALPAAMRDDLQPLHDFLKAAAAEAHRALNHFLESRTYRRLLRDWRKFLQTPPPRKPSSPNALRPIRELAGHRIRKLHRRLLREGRAITPETPAESIHELRKTAKKLRYLMELFRNLYPADRIGPLIKILKNLQDYLGAFQDTQVQISQLRQFADAMHASGMPTETCLAMGALLDRLHTREATLREEFAARFAGFTAESRRRHFRRLFKLPEPAGEAAD